MAASLDKVCVLPRQERTVGFVKKCPENKRCERTTSPAVPHEHEVPICESNLIVLSCYVYLWVRTNLTAGASVGGRNKKPTVERSMHKQSLYVLDRMVCYASSLFYCATAIFSQGKTKTWTLWSLSKQRKSCLPLLFILSDTVMTMSSYNQ